MNVKEILRLLCKDGWRRVASHDGHRQFKHPTKPGRVTVSGQINHNLPPAALNSILQPLGAIASHSANGRCSAERKTTEGTAWGLKD
jgi:predicted RNA binding protein YcfA (HicA-like mRNA interferase family)